MRHTLRLRACVALTLALPLPCLLFPRSGAALLAAEKPGYVSQTYIDTVIQRAYENFSNAMLEAATQMSQEQAIERARNVIEQLKRLAKSDVNSKYILWKVSELEYQVFLEEREMVQQKRTQHVVRLNELVELFNAEIGRSRPDFVRLGDLAEQFAALDRAKGREIVGLIARRGAAVSRQVTAQINAALEKGDMERVRSTLDYCYANQGALGITGRQIEQYNHNLESRVKLTDQRRYIEEDMHTAQQCVALCDLHGARRTLDQIERRLGNIGGELSSQQLRVYQAHRDRIIRTIIATEDSLVDCNIEAYNSKGRAFAQEYMDKELRSRGVSREKLAVVDHAMMGAAAMERSELNPELRRVFVDLSDASHCDGIELLNELGQSARRRTQERADSTQAARIAQEQAEYAQWYRQNRRSVRRAEREKQKSEKALAQQAQKQRERETRTQHVSRELQKAQVALAGESRGAPGSADRGGHDANSQLAQQNIVLIYNLLEQGLVDAACERFALLQEPLREYLLPEVYATLEAAVRAARQDSVSR